ncbi:choice-of-anchor J domain-containing protein [Polaribacter sp. Hel1_85]|uniref:choice-of-anchor J domain-containing protein n=1 Tax=Polaribacter sp. Hel1_85 TaxID=1250005 RepID=UPI00052BF999|nr:choice-of-anchor J domain-containing protein [Polaribacter sp. Hel1_85]KGL62244.1 hypothetical protein PHEL85_2034 [Polaribacter sp. Hel1_85]
MKKIFLLLTIFSMVFTSCDPLEDINEELDAEASAIVGDVTYTLTDEDYDALDLSYGSFSSEDDAKAALPSFLANKYSVWGKGSSALIEYQLYIGNADGISDYTYVDTIFTFQNKDYPGYINNAFALYPDEDPSDILAVNFPNAEEGDIILAKYKQFTSEPVAGITNLLEADFNGTLSGFDTISVLGSKGWYSSSYQEYTYAKMSAYNNGENEDWLISPEIDLTNQSNLTFQVNQAAAFVSDRWDLINVLISSNYSGDQATADWDVIDIQTLPTGDNYDYDYVLSEEIDLTVYEGKKIHIAFKYESTESVAATWQIDNVVIKTPGVEGETINYEGFYTFIDGSWVATEGVYFINDADFSSMGLNNFGSSIPADDYLPTFLKTKYPYAQEEDELIVIYDYISSSSGAQLRGNLYTFSNGSWVGYESTITTTLQLAHDGATWVPDNTIKYEFVASDYTLIADTFRADYPSSVLNLETYGNISTFNWTAAQIDEVVNVVIKNSFSGMEEDQKFAVTIYMYNGSSQNVTINYILKSGVYIRN